MIDRDQESCCTLMCVLDNIEMKTDYSSNSFVDQDLVIRLDHKAFELQITNHKLVIA